MSSRLAAVARAPVVHFLALGALLFLATLEAPPRHAGAAREPVVVTAAEVARLEHEWTREHGRPPDRKTMATLIARAVDEGILHRSAIDGALDRNDPAVRTRLVRLARFLDEQGASETDMAERARRLGLADNDLVIRRHLVQLMWLAAGRVGPADVPSVPEMAAYLERHRDEFATPATVYLTHVYLAADRRGAALAADAQRVHTELERTGLAPADAPELGDAFLRGPELRASQEEVARIFGPAFAAAIADQPLHRWIGPARSSYGLHLVWLHERTDRQVPPLADIQGRVLHRMLRERSTARRTERIEALRARYDVRVETPPQS